MGTWVAFHKVVGWDGQVVFIPLSLLTFFPKGWLRPSHHHDSSLFFFFLTYLFIWLLVLVVACGIFSCSMQGLHCGMQCLSCSTWDLVPWSGITPGAPALGMWSPSHWITREIPKISVFSTKENCQEGRPQPPLNVHSVVLNVSVNSL